MLKKSICLNRKRYCFNYDLEKPKSINNKIGNIDSNIIEVKSDIKCKQNPIESNSIEKNSNLTKMKEQYNMNKLNKIDLRNFNDESQNFKSSKINFKQIISKVNSYQINTIIAFMHFNSK